MIGSVREALAAAVAPGAAAVAALVRPLLEDPRWFEAAIADLAAAALADPDAAPPFAVLANGVQAGLLLHRDAHVALFAGVGDRSAIAAKRMAPRAGAIVFTGQLGLVRVIASGGAVLSLWRGGWIDGGPAPRCAPIGHRRLTDGEVLEIDGRDTAFLIEHMTGDCVFLQATIAAEAAPTACEYDAGSRALVGLAAAREDASRRQMLATLLAALDLPDAVAFDAASRTGDAHARWHVVRAWASVDADGVAPRLAEMAANDPDDELRALARATLPCLA